MMKLFLFLDDWMIDDCKDVERRYGKPKEEGPVIAGEFGSESTIELPGDQWPTKWRMFYTRRLRPDEITEPGMNPRSQFCLAESDDGIEWRRAKLPDDYRPVAHYDNCVFAETAKQIRWDPFDEDPQRRYKAGFGSVEYEGSADRPWDNNIIGWSADGIRWDTFRNPDYAYYTRVGGNDGTRTPFYSPITKQWHMVCRPYCPDRRLAITSSPDLKKWTDVYTVMHPDGLDGPGLQFYGLRVWPYGVTNGSGTADDFEGYFIGSLNVYRASLGERGPWSDVWQGECKWLGEGWSELAYSYNGLYWNRTDRQPILGRDDPDANQGFWTDSYIIGYDGEQVRWAVKRNTNSHAVRGFLSQAEMRSNGGGSSDGTQVLPKRMQYSWRHATMRKDGFAYLRSNGLGRVSLKGMVPSEGNLNINYLAPYGRVRVQACDINFKPLQGFTFDECVALQGDELHASVRWKNKSAHDLVGQHVRLEFELFDAHLYAVRWTCDHLWYGDGPIADLR